MEEKSIFENLEAQTYDKCPNCDSADTFLLPQRICTECGYNLEHINVKFFLKKGSNELTETIWDERINKKIKFTFENLEAQTYDKCPNCDSPDTFLLPQRICTECGYSLEHNNIKWFFKQKPNELTNTIWNKRIIKKIKFHIENLESYELVIDDWKIKYIKFKSTNNNEIFNLIADIEYKISKEEQIVDYYETKQEDRINPISVKKITNLNILHVAEKAKTGYKEGKKNLNYFKYAWVTYNKLNYFILDLLKHFHNETL